MSRKYRLIILSLAISFGAFFGASAAASAASNKQNFEASLDAIMAAENSPPGISVQIVKDGKAEHFVRGAGNLKTGARPGIKDHYRLASMAKAWSGAVALSLVAQGKLKLSDTVGKLLPGQLPKANKVTLAQLLHHTGGLPEYIQSKSFFKILETNPRQYLPPKKLLTFVKNDKLTAKPGTKYEYSDTDNIVVGLMAEKVTGVPYAKLLKRRVYKRFRLTGTSLPKSVNMPNPYMRGYDVIPGQVPEDDSKLLNPALAWASGGMVSTLPDVGRFFRGYVKGKFLTPKVKRAQRSWVTGSSSPSGPGVNKAGLALFKYKTKCGIMYGHTGSFPGYRVFAASSANGKRSIAYVANSQITKGPVSDLIRKSQVEAVCHALG